MQGKELGCVTNQMWSKWIIHHSSYCKCSLFSWHFWVRKHFSAVTVCVWGGERVKGVCKLIHWRAPLQLCFRPLLWKACRHLSFPCFISAAWLALAVHMEMISKHECASSPCPAKLPTCWPQKGSRTGQNQGNRRKIWREHRDEMRSLCDEGVAVSWK